MDRTPPSPAATELAGLAGVARLPLRVPGLLMRPRGRGRPVVVLPGRSVGDASTAPLRAYLASLGYRVTGWGLGTNDGQVARSIPAATEVVQRVRDRRDQPVALVGQSLGGYVAREVARRRPDLVSRIITIGTPIFAAQSPGAIRCPITAIYSEADQIVSTAYAVDRTPGVLNVEVHSTHLAMGFDPDVWHAVAVALSSRDATPPPA